MSLDGWSGEYAPASGELCTLCPMTPKEAIAELLRCMNAQQGVRICADCRDRIGPALRAAAGQQ